MNTVFPDFLGFGGWAVLSIPFIWIGLIRAWDQVIGDRDMGANLIIIGLAILSAVALSFWV
jgi:hypothetical protein